MSAAEKLGALQSFTNPNHGPAPMWVATSVLDALPQIVAVVEAAEPLAYERFPEKGRSPLEYLSQTKALAAALSALDEALS
jgi:hypothetical protein